MSTLSAMLVVAGGEGGRGILSAGEFFMGCCDEDNLDSDFFLSRRVALHVRATW